MPSRGPHRLRDVQEEQHVEAGSHPLARRGDALRPGQRNHDQGEGERPAGAGEPAQADAPGRRHRVEPGQGRHRRQRRRPGAAEQPQQRRRDEEHEPAGPGERDDSGSHAGVMTPSPSAAARWLSRPATARRRRPPRWLRHVGAGSARRCRSAPHRRRRATRAICRRAACRRRRCGRDGWRDRATGAMTSGRAPTRPTPSRRISAARV